MDLNIDKYIPLINLICLDNNTLSGLYSLFTYIDDDYMTMYNEQQKRDIYLTKAQFKARFKKA